MNRVTAIRIANYALFQVGWFACVLGAAGDAPWIGPAVTLPVVAIHLLWARDRGAEVRLLGGCLLLGVVFDALLLATGWVNFPNGWWLPGLAPYWMACMWLLFGTTLNLSMHWLRKRTLLAAAFGAVGGPLAYLAGQELGGITLVSSLNAIVALAIGWGLIMPVLGRAAVIWNGFVNKRSAALLPRNIFPSQPPQET